jgi:hypothetical protein
MRSFADEFFFEDTSMMVAAGCCAAAAAAALHTKVYLIIINQRTVHKSKEREMCPFEINRRSVAISCETQQFHRGGACKV